MAIVLPLLLLVLFGIIDFGLLLNRQLMLTEAAQETARAVALGRADAATRPEKVLGDTPASVRITPCADNDGDATVTLTYRYEPKTPLFADGFELSATGVMACAG